MRLSDIFSANGIDNFSVIPYESVSSHLLNCRGKAQLNDSFKSIIICALPYKVPCGTRNLSRYAIVPDYHKVFGDKLSKICDVLSHQHTEYEFLHFVDNSPIPEVSCAAFGGLGVLGDNKLLITKEYGSYVFLGSIVTTMPLIYTTTPIKTCTHCGACSSSCPSGYLSGCSCDCLSHITQKKGQLQESERTLIKNTGIIWGCDICQDVCPMNAHASETQCKEFLSEVQTTYDGNFDERRAYAWRGKATIDRNLNIINERFD